MEELMRELTGTLKAIQKGIDLMDEKLDSIDRTLFGIMEGMHTRPRFSVRKDDTGYSPL